MDKNNSNFNTHLADSFNSTIDSLALLELPLLDRMFTWTNSRDQPTLARLDPVLLNLMFSSTFPNTSRTSQPRLTSDHVPLLVDITTTIPKTATFHFENSWLRHPSFLTTVLSTWSPTIETTDAVGTLVATSSPCGLQQRFGHDATDRPPLFTPTVNSSSNCLKILKSSATSVLESYA